MRCELTTQKNSIISDFQVNSCRILVSDVNVAQGGKQAIITPNGIMIPMVFEGGFPYIEHYYPTDKQMRDIIHKEIMTSLGE